MKNLLDSSYRHNFSYRHNSSDCHNANHRLIKRNLILFGLLLFFLTVGWQLSWSSIKQLWPSIPQVQAERLQSDSYVIQFGNFNTGSGKGIGSSYGLTYTLGQTAPGPFGQYGTSNYFIGSGFQYIYQIQTFGFAIDNTAIDLGELTVGGHNSASNILTITTRGAGGYSIYAYEQNPLRHSNGVQQIDDTVCDGGGCDETIAGVWSNQSVPGFGFNVQGSAAAADFLDSTYFRQFADDSTGENMQVILSNPNIVKNQQATITYKAGVSGTVAAGNYQTGVVFVAVPGY